MISTTRSIRALNELANERVNELEAEVLRTNGVRGAFFIDGAISKILRFVCVKYSRYV